MTAALTWIDDDSTTMDRWWQHYPGEMMAALPWRDDGSTNMDRWWQPYHG